MNVIHSATVQSSYRNNMLLWRQVWPQGVQRLKLVCFCLEKELKDPEKGHGIYSLRHHREWLILFVYSMTCSLRKHTEVHSGKSRELQKTRKTGFITWVNKVVLSLGKNREAGKCVNYNWEIIMNRRESSFDGVGLTGMRVVPHRWGDLLTSCRSLLNKNIDLFPRLLDIYYALGHPISPPTKFPVDSGGGVGRELFFRQQQH